MQITLNCFGKNGGDDETRTRDLCRDSETLTNTYKNIQGTDGILRPCRTAKMNLIVYHVAALAVAKLTHVGWL